MDTENEIECLNQLITQYEEAGDAERLAPLLAEDFTILGYTGERQDRQVFLNSTESARNRGRRIENPKVLVTGETAQYTCIIVMSQDAEGKPAPARFFNSRVFVRQGGEWRCASWQVFRMPPDQNAPDVEPTSDTSVMLKPVPAPRVDASEREEALARLREMVLDHLAIPRPGRQKHMIELEDNLLPNFMETAQHAWMAASIYQPTRIADDSPDPVLAYLQGATEARTTDIERFNDILENLGVHGLMEAVAASPEIRMLGSIPVDPYEARLLQSAGHPNPYQAGLEYFQHAAAHPDMLSASEEQFEKAVQASLAAHSNINTIINFNIRPNPPVAEAKKPNRRKIALGLGKLFSGLILTTGDLLSLPSLTLAAVTAPIILTSVAGGIVAVGEGAGELLNEGKKS